MNKITHTATFALLISLAATAEQQERPDRNTRESAREQAMERNSSAKYEDILGRNNNGPAPRTPAPDFELTPIKEYEFELAGTPLRLSDFAGHLPVVLIFGSYT